MILSRIRMSSLVHLEDIMCQKQYNVAAEVDTQDTYRATSRIEETDDVIESAV